MLDDKIRCSLPSEAKLDADGIRLYVTEGSSLGGVRLRLILRKGAEMKLDFLKHVPVWALLVVSGAVCVLVGSSTKATAGKISFMLAERYQATVIIAGGILIVFGLVHSLRSSRAVADLPVSKIELRKIEVVSAGSYPKVRIVGRVEPPVSGIRVWIVREHLAELPGQFHVGARPALSDTNGEWQQYTNLWRDGGFRIHAVVGTSESEMLFSYYRRAFEHARALYREKVDPESPDFPGWPLLERLPAAVLSDFETITI